MMIKLSENTDETEDANIYEEINPPDRKMFLSISKGRRDNMQMYKFADWDLEDNIRNKKQESIKIQDFIEKVRIYFISIACFVHASRYLNAERSIAF